MNRRTKQIGYGLFYLVFWCAIIFVFYTATIKPAPLCTDGIKNGQETEVDCGGPTCQSCAIAHLLPIRFLPVQLLPATSDGHATAFLEFQNPNSAYGAAAYRYEIIFYGAASSTLYTTSDTIVVYPSEVHYAVLANLPFKPSDVVQVSATGTAIRWRPENELPLPKTSVRNVKLTMMGGNRGLITGVFRNDNAYPLMTAAINALLVDTEDESIAASKTVVQEIQPSEDRSFQIAILLPPGASAAALADPRISIEAKR